MPDLFIVFIQTATLFVLVGQLFLLHRTLKADHERKRKQATIEFVGASWRENRTQIESKLGTNRLNENQLKEIREDVETEGILKNFLNAVEHLAVGLNSGVYDKEILYRMNGTLMVIMYDRYEPYITLIRKDYSSAYIEFENIVTEFKNRKRISVTNSGNIKYS